MLELPSSMSVNLGLFFVIGLLGGAHCVGMCGPLVTIYSSKMKEHTRTARRDHLSVFEVRQHALFNAGRTVSYAIIGGLFGALGSLVFVTTNSLTAFSDVIRGSVGAVIGLFVVAIGVYYLLGRTSFGLHVPGFPLGGLTGWLSTRVTGLVGGPGVFGLGAVHGLLPCPILYPAFLYAFAVGSPTVGFLSLAALGLGTFPAVFLYGTVIDTVDPMRRRQLHRILGVAFIVLGYVLLAHGIMAFGIHLPHPELPHYQPLHEYITHHHQ